MDRKILLDKLEYIGVNEKMQKLLTKYERKQLVNFGGYESDWEGVEVWVPQVSVFEPLLFLVYINYLQNITSLKVLNFSDDTLLYSKFEKDKYKTDIACLNSQLDNISK